MPLNLGNKPIKEVYLGGKKLSKIYLGDKLVYESVKENYITVITLSNFVQLFYDVSVDTFAYTNLNIIPNIENKVILPEVTSTRWMFFDSNGIISVDLSHFNMVDVTDMYGMFQGCTALERIVLPKIDMAKVSSFSSMFFRCNSLNHIRCTQAFKDYCLANPDVVDLPTAMRTGGTGTWEIVG